MNETVTKTNGHAITTGLTSYLSTGRWPKGASYVQRLLNGLRRGLERAVVEHGDKVDEYAACIIQSACRHEARALLLQRKLRREVDALTTDQYLALLRDIGSATDARDKCLRALRLDRRDSADVFDGIYSDLSTTQEQARDAAINALETPQADGAPLPADAADRSATGQAQTPAADSADDPLGNGIRAAMIGGIFAADANQEGGVPCPQ
jgi:hypothetical protein